MLDVCGVGARASLNDLLGGGGASVLFSTIVHRRPPMRQESVLERGGTFVGEQVFTDVYWDTPACGLTERDWWLRTRAGRWELKASECVCRQYENLEKICP